jgi:hypothetical protein
VPPVAVTVAEPLEAPKQVTSPAESPLITKKGALKLPELTEPFGAVKV